MKTYLLLSTLLIALFIQAQTSERYIFSSNGTDVSYRISRSTVHAKDKNCEVHKGLKSGEDVLKALQGTKPIKMWVHYSHGRTDRIYGKNPKLTASWFSNGLVLTDNNKSTYSDCKSLNDLQNLINQGQISFSNDSKIFLGACSVGQADKKTGLTFAQELANITGATVIGGGHQTEPEIETYKKLSFHSHLGFKEFKPYMEPKFIGHSFDVSEWIKN